MRGSFVVTAAALLAMAAMPGAAGAAGYCSLPDGSMGLQCVVSTSGQVYGCVKDLKDCGALSPVQPSGASGAKPADGMAPSSSGPPPVEGQKIGKSRSNIQNN
jgi:hypothetical protein